MRYERQTSAISENISLVLTFSIIITAISFTVVFGTQIIEDTGESNKIDTMEVNLELLKNDFYALTDRKIARGRGFRLKDGELSVQDVGGNVILNGNTYAQNVLRYDIDGRGLNYELGALFYNSQGVRTMTSKPEWIINNDTIYIDFHLLRGGSIEGDESVFVNLEVTGRVKEIDSTTATSQTINIITPNAKAWQRYFEEKQNSTDTVTKVSRSGSAVTVVFDNYDRMVVSLTEFEVEIS